MQNKEQGDGLESKILHTSAVICGAIVGYHDAKGLRLEHKELLSFGPLTARTIVSGVGGWEMGRYLNSKNDTQEPRSKYLVLTASIVDSALLGAAKGLGFTMIGYISGYTLGNLL